MAFCDFCECERCKYGIDELIELYHAECLDGRWICDICFLYDCCTSDPVIRRNPCEDHECEHRPKLKNKEWLKL